MPADSSRISYFLYAKLVGNKSITKKQTTVRSLLGVSSCFLDEILLAISHAFGFRCHVLRQSCSHSQNWCLPYPIYHISASTSGVTCYRQISNFLFYFTAERVYSIRVFWIKAIKCPQVTCKRLSTFCSNITPYHHKDYL